MADTTTVREREVHAEDVLPVRSRVSWEAIFAGAFVALALSVLLNLLGAAIGLSVGNWMHADSAEAERTLWGVGIWATIASLIALFIGGWVTSQVTAGENKMEAAIYGLALWGVLFAMLFALSGWGLHLGLTAFMAVGTNDVNISRVAGADANRDPNATADEVRNAANDPATREAVREQSKRALWWALFGTGLSMAAAVGGALAGAGPSPILAGIMLRRRTVTTGAAFPAPR
jgi:hypothetical protein